MVTASATLKHKILTSELEALLVEADLIRTYLPPFNIALKDDKSPLYIHIAKEEFPRVTTVRKKEIITHHLNGTIIGPFPSSYKVREVLRIARSIFPWCSAPAPTQKGPIKKPCFYYHIKMCTGACVDKVNAEEYQFMIKELVMFLRGKTREVIKDLKQNMEELANQEKFEKAAILRNQIQLITEVTSSYYKLKPDLILSVSLTNNEANEQLLHLRDLLHTYQAVPQTYDLSRMETYDVSNLQGQQASVAMVTATEGAMDSEEYRLFNIRTLDTPNDYHMMKEALLRRQNHQEWGIPQLIVIDGGRGQLRAALSVWQWSCPVISIAKNPDRIIIPQINWSTTMEERQAQLEKLQYHIIKLPETHPALKMIQKMRDEAHRFSKKQFTRRKLKEMFS